MLEMSTLSLELWELHQLLFLPVSVNPNEDLGAAYGTAKSGVGISSMGVLKPELIFKSIIPVVMAGILGIYGLIVCIILQTKLNAEDYTARMGYKHLAAGLCCGFSSLVRY